MQQPGEGRRLQDGVVRPKRQVVDFALAAAGMFRLAVDRLQLPAETDADLGQDGRRVILA